MNLHSVQAGDDRVRHGGVQPADVCLLLSCHPRRPVCAGGWAVCPFGPQIAPVIERRIGLVMAVIAAAIVLGVVAMAVLH
jgi:hypothetical protein